MKKLLLAIVTVGSLAIISDAYAEVTSTQAVTRIQGDTNTDSSAKGCPIPGDNAFKNINNTLAKFGYGHSDSIAMTFPLQIVVNDKSNKNKWLFFDFDPDTGRLIGNGTAIMNKKSIVPCPPGSSTCSLYTKPATTVNS